MAVSLKKMQDWCRIGGRVQLGCYLQTISWSDGVGEREIYADMNVFVHEADLLGGCTRMAETAICWRDNPTVFVKMIKVVQQISIALSKTVGFHSPTPS